jgi:radical SAM protein with 4Fe4S-binding SPASM domain
MPAGLVGEMYLSAFLEELGGRKGRIPFSGTFETTFRCNLRCVHCYVNLPTGLQEERQRELPLARQLELIDEFADAGCIDLLLTGGEVLVREGFAELYQRAVRRGLRVSVFTNATLIAEPVLDLFDHYPPLCVEVTLYGATRDTYERITRVPGSFDRCIAGIERLHGRGVRLKLKTMVMTWNEHEVEAMRTYAQSLGAPFRHDGLLNPRVDCGVNRNQELQLPADRLVAIDLSDPTMHGRYRKSAESALGETSEKMTTDYVYTCGGGHTSFHVDPYGRLMLCQLSRRSFFDLRHGAFETGWNDFFPKLRSRLRRSHTNCRTCTLLAFCGNCPGVAEMEYGDAEERVEKCCQITHLRVHSLLGDACGHQADGSCCLRSSKSAETVSPIC